MYGLLLVRGAFVVGVMALVLVAGASSAGPARALPGENGKIAYVLGFEDPKAEIYVSNTDGSEAVNVTNDPGIDASPAWSPDGSKIAFASDRDGDLEVFVMNADGSDVMQLTDNGFLDCCARWSPDGSRLLFHSERTGDIDVFVMNADGSEQTNLTNVVGFDGSADWSPDGTQIAFESDRSGDSQVFVMNADGTGLEQITTAYGGNPLWSPDGERIVFARYVADRPDGAPAFDVWVMNADGSGEVDLTNADVAASESFGNAGWSPDGTKVLFDGGGGSPHSGAVYVMNPDGSGRTAVTELAAGENVAFDADWQPLNAAVPAQPTSSGAGITPVSTADDTPEDDDGGGVSTLVWVVVAVVGAWVVVGVGFVVFRRFRRR